MSRTVPLLVLAAFLALLLPITTVDHTTGGWASMLVALAGCGATRAAVAVMRR